MLLFRKDTTKGDGGLISVAAWAAGEGQDTPDMKKMTDGLKGAFVACVVIVRKKEKDGKFERTADGYPVAPLSPGYNENYYRRVVESDTTGWLKVRK